MCYAGDDARSGCSFLVTSTLNACSRCTRGIGFAPSFAIGRRRTCLHDSAGRLTSLFSALQKSSSCDFEERWRPVWSILIL